MPSSKRTLTVTVKETNETLEFPVDNSTISASHFAKFKIKATNPPTIDSSKVPLRLYDPGLKNTAVCNTKICSVTADGKLFYRGYDIEELFENSTYLEVSYLLIHAELPTKLQLKHWSKNTYLHNQLERQMNTFRYDAHPMGMMIASIASLSTFTPEANPAIQGDGMYIHPKGFINENVEKVRERFVYRALGKIPTIASAVYRHRMGRNSNTPMYNSLNYCENLLYMMDKLNEPDYVPDPRLVKILDKLFILMAEHGVSCSTVMMRHLASSGVDPYTALSGTAGAMFGERKSANVITMLKEIKSVDKIDDYLDMVKNRSRNAVLAKGSDPNSIKPKLLMGFGHRIYKQIDPRTRLCRKLVMELFDLLGLTENGKIAIELEQKVANDDWFTSRNLFPNVDFWLALAFDTFDFPSDMFPVWMFIPRVSGYIAHFIESLDDPEYKIFRPRQIFIGEKLRRYEGFTVAGTPALDSNNPKTVRPVGMQTNLNFKGALDSIYDELGKIDFSANVESTEMANGRGLSKLSDWVKKTFGIANPNDMSSEMVKKLNDELDELKSRQEQIHETLQNYNKKSGLDNDDEKRARVPSSSRFADIDIMAGSNHSRVIAPK